MMKAGGLCARLAPSASHVDYRPDARHAMTCVRMVSSCVAIIFVYE